MLDRRVTYNCQSANIMFAFVAEARRVLEEEQDMIDLPVGMPTVEDLDMRRLTSKR